MMNCTNSKASFNVSESPYTHAENHGLGYLDFHSHHYGHQLNLFAVLPQKVSIGRNHPVKEPALSETSIDHVSVSDDHQVSEQTTNTFSEQPREDAGATGSGSGWTSSTRLDISCF